MSIRRNNDYDTDAIIDLLRDGKSYAEICAAHHVSRQLVSRIAIDHDLGRKERRKGPARSPEQICSGCGARTWAHEGICRPCRMEGMRPAPTAGDALPDGAWRFDPWKRIWVYVESEAS